MSTIGNCEIEILSVSHTRTNKEDGGSWLCGQAKIEWSFEQGSQTHRNYATCCVGCWDNTDDDHQEWCAANEGARVIEECLTVGVDRSADTRGGFARHAFPDQCAELGTEICQMLRGSASAVA